MKDVSSETGKPKVESKSISKQLTQTYVSKNKVSSPHASNDQPTKQLTAIRQISPGKLSKHIKRINSE